MCEADLSSADQVVIYKGDFACLQAINLTNSTTGDLVFIGGTKFYPIYAESSQLNTLVCNVYFDPSYTSDCPIAQQLYTFPKADIFGHPVEERSLQ